MKHDTKVIFDIECTCEDRNINPNYNMETIEIGAVKITNGKIVDTFETFVKPQYTDTLTDYCVKLTGITYDNLKDAPTFEEAILSFYDFIQDCTILSCGDFDKKHLVHEISKKNIDSLFIPMRAISSSHINLKELYNSVTGFKKAGMIKMAHRLNVELNGTHHRALSDASNLANIFLKLEKIREEKLRKIFSKKRMNVILDNLEKLHHFKRPLTLNSYTGLFDEWGELIKVDHLVMSKKYLTELELSFLVELTY